MVILVLLFALCAFVGYLLAKWVVEG